MGSGVSQFGSEDYRLGALARWDDAQRLREKRRWVASIYLAGRAVECILRSVLWNAGRTQEIGHDLKDLLKRARSAGSHPRQAVLRDDPFQDAVNEVAIVWRNDLRFTGDERFRRLLASIGRSTHIGKRRIQEDPIKANAISILEACESIISRGEPWCRSQKNRRSV